MKLLCICVMSIFLNFGLQDLVSFAVKDGEDPVILLYISDIMVSIPSLESVQSVISFVFVFSQTFAIHSGQYDARARVLIRHVSCLLRVCPRQLEEFEETLVEKLSEGGEESE